MKKRTISIFLALTVFLSVGQLFTPVTSAKSETTFKTSLYETAVVYVDANAATNGSGTKASPFNTFAAAAASVADSGGTIVLMGGKVIVSSNTVWKNNGDIVVTSLDPDGGTDYSAVVNATSDGFDGAYLYFDSTHLEIGNTSYKGKITFENMTFVEGGSNYRYGFVLFSGRPYRIGAKIKFYQWDTTEVVDGAIKARAINIRSLSWNTTSLPSDYAGIRAEFDTATNASSWPFLFGKGAEIIPRVDVVIDSMNGGLNISNNGGTNTVKVGDMYFTLNSAAALQVPSNALATFTGNSYVIMNNSVNSTFPSINYADGKTAYIVKTSNEATVSHGDAAGSFDITRAEGNTATTVIITNGSVLSYAVFDGDGKATITPSAGTSVLSYTSTPLLTTAFSTGVAGMTVEDILAPSGTQITLPSPEEREGFNFKGWSATEGSTTAEFAPKALYTVNEAKTLYAVWEEETLPSYTVTFMANGEVYGVFTDIEGTVIVFPAITPKKDGFLFTGWDSDITVVPSGGATVNAKFADEALFGNLAYVNGEAATNGDGKIDTPFNTFANAVNAIKDVGGTIIVTGRTNFTSVGNSANVTVTSLDPVTGRDFRGTVDMSGGTPVFVGACLYRSATVGIGTAVTTGKITFENIVHLSSGAYNFINLDGHPYEFGEGITSYRIDTGATTSLPTRASSSSVQTFNDEGIVGTLHSTGINTCLGKAEATVNGVDYTLYATVNINCNNDGGGGNITVDGPMKFTVYGSGSGATLTSTGTTLKTTSKTYVSLIKNDNATVTNNLTALSDKTYTVISGTGGLINHTGTKGVYAAEAAEGTQSNYAEMKNAGGDVVANGILPCNLTAPDYGTYTVTYSEKELYTLSYSSEPYPDIAPTSYTVASDNTAALSITLPTLANQSAHRFRGWAGTDGASTADYAAGAAFTISESKTLYAVWEAVPVNSVYFRNEYAGEIIHTSTGYEGSPITLPNASLLPYKYGEHFYGYAYENDETNTVIKEGDPIPATNCNAYPLWGNIPVGETRIYVDSVSGSDSKNGISPSTAVSTIAKAVELLNEAGGGYIICVNGKIIFTGNWNNTADITLTSLDPVSGIDYRAAVNADGNGFENGAYLYYSSSVSFGMTAQSGKITIDHLTLCASVANKFINFNGHPCELGAGLKAHYQSADGEAVNASASLSVRAIGESNINKALNSGISIVLNTLDSNCAFFTCGKATMNVGKISLTVNTPFTRSGINMGNDNGGGIVTINGPIEMTFNASSGAITKTANTVINGSIYSLYNNGASANVSLTPGEGGKLISVTTAENANLGFGEAEGEITATLNDGFESGYVTVLNESGETATTSKFTNGTAHFSLTESGNYTASYTDVPSFMLHYVPENGETITDTWHEIGTEFEISAAPYRLGYLFGGWSDGENTYEAGQTVTMPEGGITLTALWSVAPQYTISFDANGKSASVPENVVWYVNETILLSKISADGTYFLGWSENPSGSVATMNHTIIGNTTLYAQWSDSPVYTPVSYYSVPDERYLTRLYIEGTSAESGNVNLKFGDGFLSYTAFYPEDGITATVSKSGQTLSLTWNGNVDSKDGRKLIGTFRFDTDSDTVSKHTSDEAITLNTAVTSSYVTGGASTVASVRANNYKGIISAFAEVSGSVTLMNRERGISPRYDLAVLEILDSDGDLVGKYNLEEASTDTRKLTFKAKLPVGSYTLKANKNGYVNREVSMNITESGKLSDIPLFCGDTCDETGNGDGVIDIDDFVRILRGFSTSFPLDTYISSLDIDEDGILTVSDLATVKSGLSFLDGSEKSITSSVNESYRLLDWSISVSEDVINIVGGSDTAVTNARSYVESEISAERKLPISVFSKYDYDFEEIKVNNTDISQYRIVVDSNNATAVRTAETISNYLIESVGIEIPTVTPDEMPTAYEICVGDTGRVTHSQPADTDCEAYVENGKIYVFYGDEQAAELAGDLVCEKLLGNDAAGYTGSGHLEVANGASYTDSWEVLSHFALMSDTHIGYDSWGDYSKLISVYDHLDALHAEDPFDFVLLMGDNIDQGYNNNDNCAPQYAKYIETLRSLDMVDADHPFGSEMAAGKIPLYEMRGNHDTADMLRFFKNKLFYSVNEDGKKVAYITFFASYKGLPSAPGTYMSTGLISNQTLDFIEQSLIEASGDPDVEHIVLSSHWSIYQGTVWPIFGEGGLDRLKALGEKYGAELFMNGHEHNSNYPIGVEGVFQDINCGSVTATYATVKITTRRAVFTVYNTRDNTFKRTVTVNLTAKDKRW